MSGQAPFNPYHEPSMQGSGGQRPNIPNHMVKAILSTLFCCLPLGIVAIVFAAQVNGKLDVGDFNGAKQTSDQASFWGNLSIWLGLAGMVAYLAFVVLMVVLGARQ